MLDTNGIASTTADLSVGLLAFQIIFGHTSTNGTPMHFKVEEVTHCVLQKVDSVLKSLFDQSVLKCICQWQALADGRESSETSV